MARYLIAGLTVEMDASMRTLSQAEPYRVEGEGPADIVLRCDPAQVLAHNPQLKTLDSAQYMGTGVLFARRLLEHSGIQLHSSCVMLDGRAYLFTAPSGTGKSTHTGKWCRLFGAQYLNDDKPALRRLDGQWMAYGTPWSGKHDLSRPQSAPVGAIAYVQRGQENQIRRMRPDEAVPYIMSQCLRMLSAEQMEKQLQLLDLLLREVPVFLLTCKNDDEAAFVSHDAMTGREV